MASRRTSATLSLTEIGHDFSGTCINLLLGRTKIIGSRYHSFSNSQNCSNTSLFWSICFVEAIMTWTVTHAYFCNIPLIFVDLGFEWHFIISLFKFMQEKNIFFYYFFNKCAPCMILGVPCKKLMRWVTVEGHKVLGWSSRSWSPRALIKKFSRSFIFAGH